MQLNLSYSVYTYFIYYDLCPFIMTLARGILMGKRVCFGSLASRLGSVTRFSLSFAGRNLNLRAYLQHTQIHRAIIINYSATLSNTREHDRKSCYFENTHYTGVHWCSTLSSLIVYSWY